MRKKLQQQKHTQQAHEIRMPSDENFQMLDLFQMVQAERHYEKTRGSRTPTVSGSVSE